MSENDAFVESMQEAALKMIMDVYINTERACIVLETETKKNCPVDLGLTRASVTHDVSIDENGITGIVACTVETAPYVHNGTGIYAKDGNGRKKPWGYTVLKGKYKGFHWTHGQKPNPFMEDAKLSRMGQIERILGGG